MAAVAMEMGGNKLLPYLPIILPPLLRDSADKTPTTGKYILWPYDMEI